MPPGSLVHIGEKKTDGTGYYELIIFAAIFIPLTFIAGGLWYEFLKYAKTGLEPGLSYGTVDYVCCWICYAFLS